MSVCGFRRILSIRPACLEFTWFSDDRFFEGPDVCREPSTNTGVIAFMTEQPCPHEVMQRILGFVTMQKYWM